MSETFEEIMEAREGREWQDGDDSELYDSGYDNGYKQGIWDAVALINENEDTEFLWSDIYKALQIKSIAENLTECPNHEGNFDCTPFCPQCEGNQ